MSAALKALLLASDFPEGTAWQRRACRRGEVVIDDGEPACDVFVLLSGQVRVLGEVDLDADRHLRPGIGDLDTGAVFGEMCLFDRQPRSGRVIAVDEVELAVISGDVLRAHLDAHPEIGYPILKDMLNALATRLRTANSRVCNLFAWGLKVHGIEREL